MTIGDRIKKRRMELDLSAEELADKIGKSRATVYRYENGDIENMPTTVLEPLADALYTTPAYLIGWTDDPHDWKKAGNGEGIFPPKDYEGNYEDYMVSKMYEEQDAFNSRHFDLYDNAIAYLKQLGCQVNSSDENDDIHIVTPKGEKLLAKKADLTYNFMCFGASGPEIRKLIFPRRIADLRPDEKQILNSFNQLNASGRIEAQKRMNELNMIPVYTDKNTIITMPAPDHLISNAAHARTDIDIPDGVDTSENDIMDDENF